MGTNTDNSRVDSIASPSSGPETYGSNNSSVSPHNTASRQGTAGAEMSKEPIKTDSHNTSTEIVSRAPSIASGLAPGMASGITPSITPGITPGIAPGIAPGMAPGMAATPAAGAVPVGSGASTNGSQTIPAAPQFVPQQYVQQNQNGQCYCLMPIRSGLPHAPYIYQCIPISTPPSGTIPILPTSVGQPPSLSIPAAPPSSEERVDRSQLLPCNSCGGNCGSSCGQSCSSSLDTVATALTQMKSSQVAFDAGAAGSEQSSSSDLGAKGKPRQHACHMQDCWGHVCKRTFTRPYDLLRHQETVHGSGSKSFCCEMCGCKSKKFSRQDSLARHIRRMHQRVDRVGPSNDATKVEEADLNASIRESSIASGAVSRDDTPESDTKPEIVKLESPTTGSSAPQTDGAHTSGDALKVEPSETPEAPKTDAPMTDARTDAKSDAKSDASLKETPNAAAPVSPCGYSAAKNSRVSLDTPHTEPVLTPTPEPALTKRSVSEAGNADCSDESRAKRAKLDQTTDTCSGEPNVQPPAQMV